MIINLNNKVIMTPKFSVIDGVLRATDGIFSGQIDAETGSIGGWTISKNYQITYTDSVTTGVESTQYTVFMRSNQSYVPGTDTTTPADTETRAFGVYHRLYNGSMYGDWVADFYVTHGGKLYANNAVITGQITANSLTLGNNATISKGSTPAAGATGFNVSSAGLLTASNAVIYGTIYATAGEFTGKITARTGAIGGFVISSSANTGTTEDGGHIYTNSLYTHSSDSTYEYESGLAGGGAYNNATFYIRRIEAGDSWNNSSYMFYVRNDGYMYATKGNLGGWNVTNSQINKTSTVDTSISTNQTQYQVYMRADSTVTEATYAFCAMQRTYRNGSYGNWSSNFYVTYGGYLYVTKGSIAGSIITSGINADNITTGTISSANSDTSWNLLTGVFVTTDGTRYTRVTAGRVRFMLGDSEMGRIGPVNQNDEAGEGVALAAGESATYLGLGHRYTTSGGGVGYQSDIIINCGVNPDGKTQRLYFRGDSYFKQAVTMGSTLSLVGKSITLGAGTSDETTISCHVGTGGRVRIANGLTVGSGAVISGYEMRVFGSLYVNDTMSASTVTQRSDETQKDIVPWDDRLDELIDRIEPIYFRWKDSEDKSLHVGVGARKTESILKELGLEGTGIVTVDGAGYAVNYIELSMILLHRYQQLKKRLEQLEQK